MKNRTTKRILIAATAAMLLFPTASVSARGRGACRNNCTNTPKYNCENADRDCQNADCDYQNAYCDWENRTCSYIDENQDGICDNCDKAKECSQTPEKNASSSSAQRRSSGGRRGGRNR